MATAAAGLGAVSAQEAREAETGALNAGALVRALARAAPLAARAAEPREALALALIAAGAPAAAVSRARLRRHPSESGALQEAVHRRRRARQRHLLEVHCVNLCHRAKIRAVRTVEALVTVALSIEAVACARAVVRTSMMLAAFAVPWPLANTAALNANATTSAVTRTSKHIAGCPDPAVVTGTLLQALNQRALAMTTAIAHAARVGFRGSGLLLAMMDQLGLQLMWKRSCRQRPSSWKGRGILVVGISHTLPCTPRGPVAGSPQSASCSLNFGWQEARSRTACKHSTLG
mmetsp:Transcript_20745/g.45597  ORF Transcript_20745/g.45597 Transcript_20745/m.45597 type:complete len:290 (-) Transcript_20745:774-1643(-)